MDDIRPRGTVEVRCSHEGCGWCFWLDPLDPRLPDGPFDCGADHEADAVIRVFHDQLWERHGMLWRSSGGLRLREGVDPTCGCAVTDMTSGIGMALAPDDRFVVYTWTALDELCDVDAVLARATWHPTWERAVNAVEAVLGNGMTARDAAEPTDERRAEYARERAEYARLRHAAERT